MQPDGAAKGENREGAGNATKHAHETRERLPMRQTIQAGSRKSGQTSLECGCQFDRECNSLNPEFPAKLRVAMVIFLRFPIGATN